MSYQVLARKWRPSSFEALVGQSHVVRALTNALNQQRLHHAYLFTGTRGVGKTTLGRILAKCLNCDQGISATPCNTCHSCQEITSGRFLDLIEVDAASRTKVEDTRELLENVPYSPTSGRFKVYLIDEVHMLSTHSFNALLKTLEEPPPHVKFFLATTDPQKLPITVLSRCLQFHLKCLSPEQIGEQLAFILQQENIAYEKEALRRIAHAAEGSMRDALSLLDQAIAFSDGKITTTEIKLMLSAIESSYLYQIIEALGAKQASQLINITQDLAEKSVDFSHVLEELLALLHQIAITQFVKETDIGAWDKDKILQYVTQFSVEDIQLFYQIALIGRKDLPLAPTPRIGLEMVLLRMLAFQPSSHDPLTVSDKNQTPNAVIKPELSSTPAKSAEPSNQWQEIFTQLNLTGISNMIAQHCILEKITDTEIILAIDPAQSVLLNKKQEERLAQALQEYFKKPLQLMIHTGQSEMNTPASQDKQKQSQLKSAAKTAIEQDITVKKMIETFNAKILPDSIEANES